MRITDEEWRGIFAVVKTRSRTAECVLSLTEQRVDARQLPVANCEILGRAVRALRPMPQRRLRKLKHLLAFNSRAIGLPDQVPSAVETVGRKELMRFRFVYRCRRHFSWLRRC